MIKNHTIIIYGYLIVLIIGVFFTIRHLRMVYEQLLINTATKIINIPANKLPLFFPNDTVAFFTHINNEIELSNHKPHIDIFFENLHLEKKYKYALFIKYSITQILKNNQNHTLSSLITDKDDNYISFEFTETLIHENYFSISFIKEKGKGKLFRINNLHIVINHFDFFRDKAPEKELFK